MDILLTSTSFQDTPGEHQEYLKSLGYNVDYLRGPVTSEVLLPVIGKYHAVICGDDEYTEDVLEKGRNGKLKYISKYGVGLDKIDLKAADRLGIKIKNCPGVNQVAVAEHVIALLLTFEKNIHLQYSSVQKGSWNRKIGTEVFGKKIGIIGLGAIGTEVAKRASALGLNVIGFDLHENKNLRELPNFNQVESIDIIKKEADYISLHLPLNSKTEHLIDDLFISSLSKKAIIINTSRGKIVDASAIVKGIKSTNIKAYLTDVLATEPIAENEELLGYENIIITPHIGSRTYESVQKQGKMAVENLQRMINS